mmetsp:Transcript_7594/g.13398  ORF Transcript_7594/g.13398 Transcript_7594/m.13398 type:complete len:238 (-) Transcript_7594:68-781(-)
MKAWAPSAQIIFAITIAHQYYPIIPIRDILFCTLYPAYLLAANHYRFASNLPIRERPNDHPHNVSVVASNFFSGENDVWFKKYMAIAVVIGVVFPLITIFCAPAEVGVLSAPSLFVLFCQIIGESIVFFNHHVHRFITILVPVGFSVYRINLLVEWFVRSVSMYNSAAMGIIPVWYTLGLVISGLNLTFWSYNLFVMLLLRVFPEYLAETKCESPNVRVVSLPFIREHLPSSGGKQK